MKMNVRENRSVSYLWCLSHRMGAPKCAVEAGDVGCLQESPEAEHRCKKFTECPAREPGAAQGGGGYEEAGGGGWT